MDFNTGMSKRRENLSCSGLDGQPDWYDQWIVTKADKLPRGTKTTMYREMDMRFYLEQAEAALRESG